MNTDQVLGYVLGPFGTLVLAVIVIVSGYKKLWVFGWYAKELHDRNVLLEERLSMLLEETKDILDSIDE